MQLWTPDSPFLYPVEIRLEKGPGGAANQVLDRVTSYFALRSVGIAQGPDKNTRIVLNGKPVFLIGPLDQGFWPDGLYTAPTDEALKSDIEVTKKLGFNLIRKHVKVEPARWYYWCDKLGIAVFQDMPSGDAHVSERAKGPREIRRSAQSVHDFDTELKDLIDSRRAVRLHHRLGAVQRGLGPVRHGPPRQMDQGVRSQPARRSGQRLERFSRGRRARHPRLSGSVGSAGRRGAGVGAGRVRRARLADSRATCG